MPETLLAFLQRLVSPGRLSLRQGECLFQAGDRVVSMYGIEQGAIRMVRFTGDGQELVIYRAGSGESFAEASLFGEVYHCTVLAETETRLLVFPRDEILAAMEREPGLFRKYSALLSRQVRDLRSLLEVRSLRSAEERILHFLRLHADANGRYRAAPTLMDLAGHLGLAHETLYRALKRLEKSGRIRRRGLEMFLC